MKEYIFLFIFYLSFIQLDYFHIKRDVKINFCSVVVV